MIASWRFNAHVAREWVKFERAVDSLDLIEPLGPPVHIEAAPGVSLRGNLLVLQKNLLPSEIP